MDARLFLRRLGTQEPAPVYLFKGSVELAADEAWQRLVERCLAPAQRQCNGERLFANEVAAAEVLNRIRTMPMFGGRRLILVKNIERWSKTERKLVEAYAAAPVPSATLVLVLSGASKWKRLETAMSTTGVVVDFKAPTGGALRRWLLDRADGLGKRLDAAAAAALVELVGEDLSCLDQELTKLAAYTGERPEIKAADVEKVVSDQRVFSVFELINYVGRRQPDKAMISLQKLLAAGESPLPILALLARQVRMIWQVKDGLERGLDAARIRKRLHLPAFVVKQYIDQGRYFDYEQLRSIHERLLRTDLAFKRTGLRPERVLETLVFSLCRMEPESQKAKAHG